MSSKSTRTPIFRKNSLKPSSERVKNIAPRAARAPVRILGIDPGSQITGFGLVDVRDRKTTLIESGVIRTKGEHSSRLRQIFLEVGALVEKFQPAELAIERVFVHRNADSALKLGQAMAAALCATFEADIPIYEYAARHIKKAVVGSGAADKSQVQQMIKMLLAMQVVPPSDAADALAVALCHANERGTRELMRQVAAQS